MFGGSSVKKVLVIKFEGLASFVYADAAFAAIRAHHQGDRIVLLTKPDLARLAKEAPYFDAVATDGGPKNLANQRMLLTHLKREGFHYVYDLDRSDFTKRIFRAMSPFPPKWCGDVRGAKFRYEGEEAHPIDDFAAQLDTAGVDAAPRPPNLDWVLAARKGAANTQPSWYGLTGPFAILSPSISGENRWPTMRWADLSEALTQVNIIPVLIGATDVQAVGNAIVTEAPSTVNLIGKTDLLQAAALAASSAFYVGEDTDIIHLFASVGASGVVLLPKGGRQDLACPRGRNAIALTAEDLADLRIQPILQTLANAGHFDGIRSARRALIS